MAISPVVLTDDIERLSAFYCAVLDGEVVDRFPRKGDVFYLFLRIDGSGLGLVAHDSGNDAGRILLDAQVTDCEQTMALVKKHGGTVEGPPTDMPWGQRVAHVKDPDGNALNLSQAIE